MTALRTGTPSRRRSHDGAAALVVVCAATLLVLMNYTAPMTVLPQTAAGLGAGLTAQTWLLNAITLGLAAFLLIAGSVADDYGRRRTFLAGIALLALGSLGCALALDPLVFVLARVVQGGASAAILAAGLGLLGHTFPDGPGRAHATTRWGAMLGAGIALGPAVSAGMATIAGWRSYYLLIAALSAVLLYGARLLDESRSIRPPRLDLPGALSLGGSLALLLVAVTAGRTGWLRAGVAVPLALSVLLMVGFVVVEYRGRQPMLELNLFRRPDFRLATAGALCAGLAVIGPMSFLPTIMQRTMGLSPVLTAGIFAVWSGTSFVVALRMRRFATRLTPRRDLAVGLLLAAAGDLAMLGFADAGSWPRALPGLVIAGVGSGVLNASLARQAVTSVPAERVAMGSGANNTARYLGSALGLALVVAATSTVPATRVAPHASPRTADVALLVGAALAVLGVVLTLAASRRVPLSPSTQVDKPLGVN
jgi:MFS family permease